MRAIPTAALALALGCASLGLAQAPAAAPAPRQMQRTEQQQRSQESQQRAVWDRHRATISTVHRSWRQRGGYHGMRIPATEFAARFGRSHPFRVYPQPFLVVRGVPRFQFNGYWFSLVEPIPAYWPKDWFQNDDVYVAAQGDGYYLCDSRFPKRPGVAISLSR